MNPSRKHESPAKRRRFVRWRAHVIGATTGLLLTAAGVGIFAGTMPHRDPDLPMAILAFISIPAGLICAAFGGKLHLLADAGQTQKLAVAAMVMIFATNAVVLAIIAGVVARFFRKSKNPKKGQNYE